MRALKTRQDAIRSGAPTYIGSKCRKCGECISRTSGGACVKCVLERDKIRYYTKPERRLRHIKKKFGLSQKEFEWLFYNQDEKCANKGCNNLLDLNTANREHGPHIDHHHGNDHIRGILCGPCNRTLGMAKDDVSRLRGLADYLEKDKERQADFKEDILKGVARVAAIWKEIQATYDP